VEAAVPATSGLPGRVEGIYRFWPELDGAPLWKVITMTRGMDGHGDAGGRNGLSADEAALFLTGGKAGRQLRDSGHEAHPSGGTRRPPTASRQVLELHVCMGLNACAGHDVLGTASLPGVGRCATALHVCHSDNQCRGQGGCGYAGSEFEQTKPGEQSCMYNGSCASPINECRVASAGPFKGTSVWKLARTRFETRMWESGVPFGPAPGQGFPNDLVPDYEADRGKLFADLAGGKQTRARLEPASLPRYVGRA
jgi:hypothetical protein